MSLLNPTYNNKTSLHFMDEVVEHLRVLLGTNLSWLDYNYGEAFTFTQEVKGSRVLVPNVYIGSDRYLQTTIDNKKQGTCFFIVGQSSSDDYNTHISNYYNTPLSIIFEANHDLIDDTLDEYFREKLIEDVLIYLRNPRGATYKITDLTVTRDLDLVFSEFGYDVREEYKFPLTAFRIDLNIQHKAACSNASVRTECDLIWDEISPSTLVNCIIPRIDFCNADYRNAISSSSLECIIDNNMLNFYPQDGLNKGNIGSTLVIDWNNDYSWLYGNISENITSISYANFPIGKRVNFELRLTQTNGGGHTINFTGSNITVLSGVTDVDMQPSTDNGSVTKYAIQWDGFNFLMVKNTLGDTF